MTTLLTFPGAQPSHPRIRLWLCGLAAMLIAVAAPTVACEKSTPVRIAGAHGEPQTTATFTGEFVNGTPVYRLPAITVVSRRPAEVARMQRDDAQARATRSRPAPPAAAPVPAGKIATASHEAVALEPCVG